MWNLSFKLIFIYTPTFLPLLYGLVRKHLYIVRDLHYVFYNYIFLMTFRNIFIPI